MIDDYEAKYIERIIDLTVHNKINWSKYEENKHGLDYEVFDEISYISDSCKFATKEMKEINGKKELIGIPNSVYFIIAIGPNEYKLTSVYFKGGYENDPHLEKENKFTIESDNETTMEYKVLKRLYEVVVLNVQNKDKKLKITNIYAFLENFENKPTIVKI